MKTKRINLPLTILSVAIALIVIFPIFWLILSSFKPSNELFTYPRTCSPPPPPWSIMFRCWRAAS